MSQSSTALFGIEAGLLKGLDTLRWTLESLQRFAEITAVSTVVQSNIDTARPSLRVVVKTSLIISPDQVIKELVEIENEYDEKIKVMEPMRCFLLAYDQLVTLTPILTLPHPQMIANPSWLYCSFEVWRNYRHPVLELTLERLLSQSKVTNVEFFSQGKSVITKTF